MKLLRTIRLDASDRFVFDRAAEAGEWAVSGAFLFSDAEPETLSGKARTAFRSGLLGIASLGWSTLAVVTEASADECDSAFDLLADQFVRRLGAPDDAAARRAAAEEIEFAASLCDHPAQTLIAVYRVWDGADIRERFRTLRPRDDAAGAMWHDKVFAFILEDGTDAAAGEAVNFDTLMKRDHP